MASDIKTHITLIVITTLPILDIDLYLPSLPLLAHFFAPEASVQSTLSINFAGFGLAYS